jgi:hypothetical protein
MPKKGEVDLHKLKYWKAILADFERSGLKGQSYCRQKGISYTAFASRRRKLSVTMPAARYRAKTPVADMESTERSRAQQVEFAEVAVKISTPTQLAAVNGERLEVVFPTGTILRVPSCYSAVALAEIITALEV